ncbi:MAG: 3D domain-containing protein [Armatimonas sp.]
MPQKNLITKRLALTGILALTLAGNLLARQDDATIKPSTVILVENGKSVEVYSHATTVEALLKEQEIKLDKSDTVSVPRDSRVLDGLRIEITRAPKATPAPKAKPTPAPDRKATRNTTSKLASRSLASVPGVRTYTMEATAYSNAGNGPWGNRTATGDRCRRGVVAVDPRVIPMGTRLYVEGYGECVALDTGSAIKGMRIDLFMDRESECNRWGRRRVKVVVLGK